MKAPGGWKGAPHDLIETNSVPSDPVFCDLCSQEMTPEVQCQQVGICDLQAKTKSFDLKVSRALHHVLFHRSGLVIASSCDLRN